MAKTTDGHLRVIVWFLDCIVSFECDTVLVAVPAKTGEFMRGCAVLAVLFSFAACAGRKQANVAPVSSAPGNDGAFVARLVAHGDAAARILDLCRSRATRPDLKQSCTTGFDAVQKRNLQLMAWKRNWSGQQQNSSVSHDDQYKALFDQMRESKGDEFDEAAARAIRVHARESVTESTTCQDQAMHPELKQFCSELNSAEQRALENARRWICDWFKDCTEGR
jgi:uncharacterized protein (DUF305 family)